MVNDTHAQMQNEPLLTLIRTAIDTAPERLLPFDQFMELALYAPGLGYYVAGAMKFGAAGDFITAPELSPLFAHCLARTCADVFSAMGNNDILELGAGSGVCAVELFTALEQLGQLPARYWILELSPELQARQRALFTARVPHLLPRVQWLTTLPNYWRGVIFANEVVDAMPVHRFMIDTNGIARECCVTYDHAGAPLREQFVTIRSPHLAAAIAQLHQQGLSTAPGYCGEWNARLTPWLRALAETLTDGLLLLIDYGGARAEVYHSQRTAGTLICHSRHRAHSDPYQSIGLQDITAHVDFTALTEAATQAGLDLFGYTTQAHFLLDCGIEQLLTTATAAVDTAAGYQLNAGVKQLLLPTHMGERFKVIGFTRGVLSAAPEVPAIRGFGGRDFSDRL